MQFLTHNHTITHTYTRHIQVRGEGIGRVYAAGEEFPGLAVSRAFGDADGKKIGVTVDPQFIGWKIRREVSMPVYFLSCVNKVRSRGLLCQRSSPHESHALRRSTRTCKCHPCSSVCTTDNGLIQCICTLLRYCMYVCMYICMYVRMLAFSTVAHDRCLSLSLPVCARMLHAHTYTLHKCIHTDT